MTTQGWIKLHRKLSDSSFYKKSAYVHLWIHLLLLANSAENKILWNKKEITIEEGQILTGRLQLSKDTGIPQSTIEDILNVFEDLGKIRQQKTTKFRIITILKWGQYQMSNNSPTTNRQQTDTNKNKENKENTINIYSANFEKFWKLYPNKKNKKKAKDKFYKIPLEELPNLFRGLQQQLNSEQWVRDDGKWIPHPTTWLNGERWNDEIETMQKDISERRSL